MSDKEMGTSLNFIVEVQNKGKRNDIEEKRLNLKIKCIITDCLDM